MTSKRIGESLPLLHKYVLQPQDDLQLVLTKLNYRLCVKEVSKVIYRRSLGASISEAVDLIEASADMNGHREVEPLVLSDEGPQCVSSPKTLSPDDSYCGTMKSDDSGIVMDESHMNFSGDHSDLMFSSNEVSPLEEDNHILNGVKPAYLDDIREGSSNMFDEESEAETPQYVSDDDQVKEFFTGSPYTTESSETTVDSENKIEIQVEEINASTAESLEAKPTISEDQSESLLESDDLSADQPQTNEQPLEDDDKQETGSETTTEETQECENESEQEEEERVDFVKDLDADTGIRCDDVYTAIEILKTRYKLSDTTVRKFIITFSSWDVSQISHPISNRCSWWDDSQHVPIDSTEVEDLTEEIYTRQGEISELVDRIMEEEQIKHDMLQKLKKEKEEREKVEFVAPEELIEPTQAPEVETVPSKNEDDDIEKADPVNEEPSDEKDSKNNKKKNRNAWQRFVHALRKRVGRNSSRKPPPTEKDRAKA